MKMIVPFFALLAIACGDRFESYSNDVDLAVLASEAEPNRACDLVAQNEEQVRLEIAGDFGNRDEPESLNWEIVGPEKWSARKVSSEFIVGIGGESSHRWLAETGEMRADVIWWDERPNDGRDSNITLTDSAGKTYSGECRKLTDQAMDTPS